MELEKCRDYATNNVFCCEGEPYEGSENLQFKPVIENYEDYLINKCFIESKKKECDDRYSSYREKQKANLSMLKNLFLSEFVDSEKQIKGLCVHATKFTKNPFCQDYLYIVGCNKNGITEDGMYVSAIRLRFQEKNGDLTNIVFSQEDCCFISYETLYSCRITEQELMGVYSRANFKIMEKLGLNKVISN